MLSDVEFCNRYEKIIEAVQADFEKLDVAMLDLLEDNKSAGEIIPIIGDYLANKGKCLRPALMFLFAKALKKDTDDFYIKLALSIELLHNATLIHDDIIDCSAIRRGQKTINFDYDSKLAVLCGDFLIVQTLKLLFDIEDFRIREIYTQAVSKIIEGEISQYFSRFKLLSIEKYIEKSKDKTARLFEAGLVSIGLYNNDNENNIDEIRQFALNFGTAFQILNDIDNFSKKYKINEDLNNGDYSAPFIYYLQEKYNGDIGKIKDIKFTAKQLETTGVIEKTKDLAKYYLDKAIENTVFLEDNQYKKCIINLCELFKS